MKRVLAVLRVFLRLFTAWWTLVILLASMAGGLIGLGIALFFLPFMVAPFALLGAVLQERSLPRGLQDGGLGSVRRATIHPGISAEDAKGQLAAILQEDLGASDFSLRDHHLHALFRPFPFGGGWRRWTGSDEIRVQVHPAEGACRLEVEAGPLYRFLFLTLWIDRGRNARRMERFRECLEARLALEAGREASQRRAESLDGRLAQAELLLLRAQVEPHFLFNTLAHIREMLRTGEASGALEMLDRLIAHARLTSDRIRRSTQSLAEEVASVESYLGILALRFGPRLAFGIKVAEGMDDREVPVGVLMIPVENAVKHGIEPKGTPGRVRVTCREEAGNLLLEVEDDGLGLDPAKAPGSGTGLKNLRSRMDLLYDGAARMSVEGLEPFGVCFRATLPLSAGVSCAR